MKYPKMIIFDYGQTLLCEPDWDSARGNAELLKYATHNPYNRTLEDVKRGAKLIFGEFLENVRGVGCDVSAQAGNRLLYEYLGIKFSLTPLEMETVFWNGASIGAIMPCADKMLDFLNENGIRSAVISNLLWSGEALTERLNRLLPNNRFEFVMTSSDYVLRKPNRILFEIALRKSGLNADEVWFCGDSVGADIEGASSAGIFPVWYDHKTKDYVDDSVPTCAHLHIHEWTEMIDLLTALSKKG